MKHKFWYHWTSSWIDMATGVVGVVMFGFYRPYWDIRWISYCAKRTISKRMKEAS